MNTKIVYLHSSEWEFESDTELTVWSESSRDFTASAFQKVAAFLGRVLVSEPEEQPCLF